MKFYVLKPNGGIRFGTKWAYADQVDPVFRGESNRCPVCNSPFGGPDWLPPHRIKLSSSKSENWGDFVWGAGFGLMVSARFKVVYETEELSGIAVFHPPAEIVRVGRKKAGDSPLSLPTYHLIETVWNGGNVDDAASGVTRKKAECDFCRGAAKSFERVVIEPGSWTGVDIFEARGLYGDILVTERFKQVVKSHGLKNAWLIPAEQYGYDERRPGLWYVRKELEDR